MARKILYIAIAVLVAVILLIVGLEAFSSYPNDAIVYNTEAPVQSVKSIIVHASAKKTWTIMSEVNEWETWESDNKSPVLKGAFKPGNSFTWKSNGLSIHSNIKIAEPYSNIAWSGPAFGCFAIHTWTFTELPDGNTRVDVRESMEGWLVSLMSNKFQTGLDASLNKWLSALKNRAEQ
ncbi:MAG: SRPBCC family protein [Bacteroidota bacterium]